jgi:serine kinase of HPr protein (carbohydrate metabolism regulator)
MQLIHATCIELGASAVLLRGAPGSGKSDLALRLIDRGARLVADDQVEISRRDDRLYAAPPAALAGRLEVRGVGIARINYVARARLGLVVDLVGEPVERLPEGASAEYEGLALPLARLAPFEASAPAKLRLLVRALDHDIIAT